MLDFQPPFLNDSIKMTLWVYYAQGLSKLSDYYYYDDDHHHHHFMNKFGLLWIWLKNHMIKVI